MHRTSDHCSCTQTVALGAHIRMVRNEAKKNNWHIPISGPGSKTAGRPAAQIEIQFRKVKKKKRCIL